MDSVVRTPKPLKAVPRAMHGRAAVRALGDRLPAAASLNDRTPAQLRSLLVDDSTMWVAPTGRLFVKESMQAAAPTSGASGLSQAEASAPLDQTFALHSLPGSSHTIYLDFDGVSLSSANQWVRQDGLPEGPVEGWDPSGDGAAFSDQEQTAIQDIWARIAEDYAAFDVDVTTQDPGLAALTRADMTDRAYGARVAFTDSESVWQTLCQGTCSGIAWVNTFGVPETGDQYQVAWAFSHGASQPQDIALAASHEIGHNFGLLHDGHVASASTPDMAEYDGGHGVWGPIMGASFGRAVTQWSKGDYLDASNQQDDTAIIARNISLRPDEAGDDLASAGALPSGSAYVTSRDDVDYYALGECAGQVELSAKPAATAPNLDLVLTVVDAAGDVVASDAPATSQVGTDAVGMDASVTTTLPDGRYYLAIDGGGAQAGGGGDPVADYDDYGSIGAYTLQTAGCAGEAAAPGAPGLTSAFADSVLSASWTVPVADGGSPVTGYDVSLDGGEPVRVDPGTLDYSWSDVAADNHTVTVRAVNAQGPGPAAVSVTRNKRAGAPLLLGTSVGTDPNWPDPTTEFFYTNWDAPDDDGGNPVTSYRFEYEIRPGVWQTVRSVPRSPSEGGMFWSGYTVGITLSPGFPPAHMRVIAVTEAGDGAPLAVEGHIDGPPMMVGTGDSTLTVTPDKFAHTLTVDWTDPYDGGKPLQGTRVSLLVPDPDLFIEDYPRVDVHDVPAGTHTVTFHDVPAGEHLVGIEAYNELGGRLQGQYTTMPQLYVPFAVYGYEPTTVVYDRSTGLGSATVSWGDPGSPDEDTPVTGYDVSVDGAAPVRTASTSYTVPGLALGSTHEVAVSAVNLVGSSYATSQTIAVQVAPAPVTELQATVNRSDPSNLRVTGTWAPPADNGGHAGGPDYYEFRLQPVDGPETYWSGGLSAPATVSWAQPGSYLFQVRAHNDSGESEVASVPVTVKAPAVPGAVTDLTVKGLDLQAGTATVHWSAPADNGGSDVYYYSVGLKDLTDVWDNGVASDLEARTAQLSNLTRGHRYRVSVSALNSVGQSVEVTHEFVAATAPGQVTSAQAVADRDSRELTASWSAPTDDGGAAIQHYYVQLDQQAPLQLGSDEVTHTFVGVLSGQHTVTVWADNGSVGDDGQLQLSPMETSTVTMLDPTPVLAVPTAPKIGAAKPGKAGGKTTAVFAWAAPADDGGSAVTGYEVDVLTLKSGRRVGHKVFSTAASARKLQVTLVQRAHYTYVAVVRARNGVGWSPVSGRSQAVSPR